MTRPPRASADEVLEQARRELHRLSGSAATFGYPRIGRMAAALESAVKKWVADPTAFRAALRTMIPSLVVIDVELGGTSGFDLVREVRAMPTLANVPVLVLSGHADAGTRDDSTRVRE